MPRRAGPTYRIVADWLHLSVQLRKNATMELESGRRRSALLHVHLLLFLTGPDGISHTIR